MKLKKIPAWLHLWLGLASGLIVFIVSITGCIYVFEKEIRSLYEPWEYVKEQSKPFLPPSILADKASAYLPKGKANSMRYGKRDEAVSVNSFDRKKGIFVSVFMNPYTGEVLHAKTTDRKAPGEFFRIVLNGHRALWLPYNIGRPIVGIGVLIFVVLLITGIILWWPTKWIKSIRDKSFKIKWKASFKRVNYDTHNVLGFYSFLFLLMISCTGLVYSFQWFSKSLYWVTSGGKSMATFKPAMSDSTSTLVYHPKSVDKIWQKLNTEQKVEGMFITLPVRKADAIGIVVYLKANRFYKTNSYYYDQYTLKRVSINSPFEGEYAKASVADKIRRMNYDIHIGAILGIPGKIIAFFASLISASLPVTGFLVWYGRRKKKKKPTAKSIIAVQNEEASPKPYMPRRKPVLN